MPIHSPDPATPKKNTRKKPEGGDAEKLDMYPSARFIRGEFLPIFFADEALLAELTDEPSLALGWGL